MRTLLVYAAFACASHNLMNPMQRNILAFPSPNTESATVLARQILMQAVNDLLANVERAPLASPVRNKPDDIQIGHVRISPRTRTVTSHGVPVRLTPMEFDLLMRFASDTDVLLTREQLVDEVWRNHCKLESRTVDQHIMELRKKLNLRSPMPAYLRTLSKRGYVLVVDDSSTK